MCAILSHSSLRSHCLCPCFNSPDLRCLLVLSDIKVLGCYIDLSSHTSPKKSVTLFCVNTALVGGTSHTSPLTSGINGEKLLLF